MGVRESFRRNPAILVGIFAICVALMLGIWFVRAKEERGEPASGLQKSWYTTDDGRTWFAGPGNKVVPFEHQGKTAYRCYVWTCDGGKTKFVSHLERLNPTVRSRYGPQEQVEPWKLIPGAEQVKRPDTGGAGWVDAASPGAAAITKPICVAGKDEIPSPVPAE
jgi:hypothetical protein